MSFHDLPEWELWDPGKEHGHVQVFPRLRKLSVLQCPKLFGQLPSDLSALEKLEIKGCKELVVSFSNLPVLCELEIDGCDKVACSSEMVFKSLECMSLSNILNYHKWFQQQFEKDIRIEKAPLQKLQSFAHLRQLCIENVSSFISFHEGCSLTNLNKLEIRKCSSLASLSGAMIHKNPHLEELIIVRCSSLTFIIAGQLPPSLRIIDAIDCEKLECVFNEKESAENISTSISCSSSNDQFPAANLHLTIFYCPQLTSISSNGQLPDRLYRLLIIHAPKLESIAGRFHDTKNLGDFWIHGCDYLKYIPEGLDKLRLLETTRS